MLLEHRQRDHLHEQPDPGWYQYGVVEQAQNRDEVGDEVDGRESIGSD
jgi:hypothetical protein